MTLPQAFAFSILGGAVLLFAWGRFRYDLVALGALLAGLVTGVVPAKASANPLAGLFAPRRQASFRKTIWRRCRIPRPRFWP